jgi:hypothetical protein
MLFISSWVVLGRFSLLPFQSEKLGIAFKSMRTKKAPQHQPPRRHFHVLWTLPGAILQATCLLSFLVSCQKELTSPWNPSKLPQQVAGASLSLSPSGNPIGVRATQSEPSPTPSPLILPDPCTDPMSWICSLPGQTFDLTGSVQTDSVTESRTSEIFAEVVNQATSTGEEGEKRAIFPATQEQQERLEEIFSAKVYTDARVARLTAAFEWTRREVLQWIQEQPERILSISEKRLMVSFVKRVRLDLPPLRIFDPDHPDILLRSDILFESLDEATGRLILGGAFVLGADSWFALVFAFAHELGHALDPCHFESHQHRVLAMDRLSACFVEKQWVKARRSRIKCGANDQLSEVFSDWLATEMVSRALLRFSARMTRQEVRAALVNSVRDLCTDPTLKTSEASLYAPDSVRIHEIFFAHPLLRKVLRCRNRLPLYRNRCELGVGSYIKPNLSPSSPPQKP